MSHEEYREIISSLYQCAIDCIHCENACLEESSVKGLVKCIRLDRDCADACLFTAKLLAGETEFSDEITTICGKICDACAEECEKHASHMEHCKVCAESCRKCAKDCRSLVKVYAM